MEEKTNPQHREGEPPVNLPSNGNIPAFEEMRRPPSKLPAHDEKLMPSIDARVKAPSKNMLFRAIAKISSPKKTPAKKEPTPIQTPAKEVPKKTEPTDPPRPKKESLENTPLQKTVDQIAKAIPEEEKNKSEVMNPTVSTKASVTPTKTEKDDSKSFSSLRTYEDDIAKILREKNISTAQIHHEEVKQKAKSVGKPDSKYKVPVKKKRKVNWMKIFLGLLALLLTLIGVVVIISFMPSSEPEDLIVARPGGVNSEEAESFFLVNKKTAVPTDGKTRNAMIESLNSLRGGTLGPLGTVSQLYFTEKRDTGSLILSLEDVLDVFDISAPNALIRNLNKDFVYGYHVFDGNQPFLVLRTNSYGHTFAGMLEWERTLERDMTGLIIQSDVNAESAVESSADLLKRHVFKDKVVLNRDARVISNDDGSILMIYSFVNTDTVIITTNEGTLKELISRLERIRFSR